MTRRYGKRTASARAARSGASRASTYAPPWLVWLALPLAGGVFWALASFGTAAAVLVGGLLTAGSAVLVRHTYVVFSHRKDTRVRIDAAVTVGLACAWVMVTAAFGLFHNPHVDVWPQLYRIPELVVKSFTLPIWGSWLGGGIIVAVAWNIRRAALSKPEGEQDHADDEPALIKALDGAKMLALQANEKGQVTFELEADRGRQTSDDLQKLAASIEAAGRLREGAVRIAKDPKDRGKAFGVITAEDPLIGDVIWPGPSLPGGHLADAPIPFSIAEDGELGVIWFCGDETEGRNLVHYLVEGANGSGKSMAWRAAIADALTRTAGAGVRLHGVDVSGKWRQTFGALIRFMTSLARDTKAAKKLVKEMSAYVAQKQERMGAAGHTQWSKECGEPFDIFWIEEGSEIAAESQEITRAAERWRSAGVMLVIVIQRASWDNIDTTTRSQLGGATAFGVNDGGQSSNSLSLPQIAVDQGADPSRWGSRHPGRHYLITSITPEERMAIPHKAYRTTNADIEAALDQHCTPLRTADGELLNGTATSSPPVEAHQPPAPRTGAKDDFAPDDEDEDMPALPEDPDPDVHVNPDLPIRPPDSAEDLPMQVPGAGGPKISKAEFQALIQTHLRTILVEQGRQRTSAADVAQMRPETGYSREAVRLELVRLCRGPFTELDMFRLRRDDDDRPGVYEIYSAALVGSAAT